jgi:predicted AAA+ superfamily ATPase
LDSLQDFPVVLLIGARQVGKSTLAQEITKARWPARYLTLDNRAVLDAALTNPDGMIQGLDLPVVIDEVQRAPDLLRSVKLAVDQDRKSGMFLLTGSANILTMSSVSETLAGRVAVHHLHPFSWTEVERLAPPEVLGQIFKARDSKEMARKLSLSRAPDRTKELQKFILRGGYPDPCLMKSSASRNLWFESYRQTYLERDVRDLTSIAHVPDFNRLLVTLALRTGQMLNFSSLSRDVGLAVSTLRRYFNILEETFQIFRIAPYHANIGKRIVKTPKVYMSDTGMACHLADADDWQTLHKRNQAGSMLETWVAGELRKLISLSPTRTGLYYWRTRDGREVDFLLERGGRVAGIEVKQAARVDRHDLTGISACSDALGKSWHLGIVLYGGSEVLPLDHKTIAVPFSVFFGRDARLL